MEVVGSVVYKKVTNGSPLCIYRKNKKYKIKYNSFMEKRRFAYSEDEVWLCLWLDYVHMLCGNAVITPTGRSRGHVKAIENSG